MKHVVRSKRGGHRRVDVTPLKAIRLFCLECMGHKPSEVRRCTDGLCPLWPYRMGENPAAREEQSVPAAVSPAQDSQTQPTRDDGVQRQAGTEAVADGQRKLFER